MSGFNRSSHPEVFCQKGVLKNLTKFTGTVEACIFIKKRLRCRCFSVNFVKFLRTLVFVQQLQLQPFLWLLEQLICWKNTFNLLLFLNIFVYMIDFQHFWLLLLSLLLLLLLFCFIFSFYFVKLLFV